MNCSSRTGTPGILVHYFPKDESLRQKWTRFVRTHRKDLEPKKSSCLCSAHFDDIAASSASQFSMVRDLEKPWR